MYVEKEKRRFRQGLARGLSKETTLLGVSDRAVCLGED
jgi:hypothetical protein